MESSIHTKSCSSSTQRSTWKFSKYSGAGNDFILVDDRSSRFPTESSAIQALCARCTGIGADGVILVRPSSAAQLKMIIFNADGSSAEMCGNGLRCFAAFADEIGYESSQITVEVNKNIYPIDKSDLNQIKITCPQPAQIEWEIPLQVNGQQFCVHFLDTGVPHAVIFVENIEKIVISEQALPIRHHSYFSPKGVNVNFVQIQKNNTISLRTFERGIEDETLACGTGAIASALATHHTYRLPSPLSVIVQSKDRLVIHFQADKDSFSQILMQGPAVQIFKGEFSL